LIVCLGNVAADTFSRLNLGFVAIPDRQKSNPTYQSPKCNFQIPTLNIIHPSVILRGNRQDYVVQVHTAAADILGAYLAATADDPAVAGFPRPENE